MIKAAGTQVLWRHPGKAMASLGWGGLVRIVRELILKVYDFLATFRLGMVLLCCQSCVERS